MTEPTAAELDARDPLAGLRSRFRLPPGPAGGLATYLCSNSLGLQPVAAQARITELLDDWARLAVRGHHDGPRPWLTYHEQFAPPLARLVGAKPLEVVAMNTLTVNLHLMLVSFYRPDAQRFRLLIERPAFSSDRYAIVSQMRALGLDPSHALVEIGPRPGEDALRTDDVLAAIERNAATLALVLLPGVQYLSGQVLDMATITTAARRAGARVGWDLAHAIGNVPASLHDWDADFAVWCSYKYLCGGPGAVAGAFVHERYARDASLPRYAGWWGHEPATRFEMGPDFVPAVGADGWQLSNPPVLALAPLLAALEQFDAATLPRLREKSLALTARARRLIDARLAGRVEVLTPAGLDRGCQLSLRIAGGRAVGRRTFDRLLAAGTIGDWREPDVIRIAPAPLYNTYAEVDACVAALEAALAGPGA